MPIGNEYLDAITGFEGFTPKATWDYKQWSNGYGTRARFPGEVISQAEAKQRYQQELEAANRQVKSLGVALDPGKEAALTDLTYNSGSKWMNSGLGQAVKAGDWNTAKQRFLQYNKAGGRTLPGLVKRRMVGASWLGGEPPQTSPPQSSPIPTNEAPTMPNQTGVPIPASYSPETISQQRRMAMQLMQQGQDASPVQHWTQALARVLQGGMGGYQLAQADKQDRMMQGEGNALLGQFMGSMTGGASPAGMPQGQPQMLGQALSGEPAPMTPEEQGVAKFASPGLAAAMPQGAPVVPPSGPVQVADAGPTVSPEVLQKMLANPQTRGIAEKYILQQRKSTVLDPKQQADIEYKKLQTEKLRQEIESPKAKASEGEKVLDRQFAKTYEEDIAGGRLADAMTQLQTLESIAKKLESPGGENYSGPYLGLVPESVRAFSNPNSVSVQNDIANIVQRSLRPILGAQFTQQEGENLIRRAYNPQLDEATNATRLRRLVDVTRKMAQQKLAAAQYFEQNGTLKGFGGTANFSLADIESAIDAPMPNATKPADIKSKYQGLE